MADHDSPEKKSSVQLTPGKPAAPKLAAVTPGPKTVMVSVPKATPVTADAKPIVAVPKADVTQANDDLVKKGELLDQVVDMTGVKRADAKSVMEALFAVMGEQLRAEKQLQLPPLGKIKVVKSKPVGQGALALTLRVRTPNTE